MSKVLSVLFSQTRCNVSLMAWTVRPSVCHLSSVTFVQPTNRVELFRNIFEPSNSSGTRTENFYTTPVFSDFARVIPSKFREGV